jgi:hypothetical protein
MDLDSNTWDSTVTPGGLGRLNGHRLKFDQADPQQGVFLVTANGTENRVELLAKHTPKELIFRVPAGLASGDYRLEVRAIFGLADLRRGALKATLSVS